MPIQKPRNTRNPRNMGNQCPRFMKKSYSWSIRVHSWFSLHLRARHPRHPRPPPSSLLPTRNGGPLQSVHALSSSPSSLLPTLEAHCKVSTHYLLLSPPSSLLWTPTAKCPRTFPSSLLPPPYSILDYAKYRAYVCRSPPSFLFFRHNPGRPSCALCGHRNQSP